MTCLDSLELKCLISKVLKKILSHGLHRDLKGCTRSALQAEWLERN